MRFLTIFVFCSTFLLLNSCGSPTVENMIGTWTLKEFYDGGRMDESVLNRQIIFTVNEITLDGKAAPYKIDNTVQPWQLSVDGSRPFRALVKFEDDQLIICRLNGSKKKTKFPEGFSKDKEYMLLERLVE